VKPFLLLTLLTLPLAAERLTLEQALKAAEKASPDIQQARLRALEGEAQTLVVKSALGPQLSASAAISYQTSNLAGIGVSGPGFPSRVGPYRVFDTRPTLTQTVLDMPLLSQYRAAKERAGQWREDASTISERTRLAVIDVYLRALASDSRRRAAASRVETAAAVLQQVRDAEQAGTSSKLDVARALQRLETEQATLVLARRDRDSLITTLKRTIGLEQSIAVELDEFRAAPAEPPISTRHEMRALEAKRRALVEDSRAAERQRWPRVQASGDFGVLGQDPANSVSTYTVGASVAIPLWTSGRIENEIKAAKLRLSQWEQEKHALELAISQEVAQAQIERDAALEALAVTARAAAAARETLELARLRYGAGLTTNLDVITAQGNLAQTEEDEIRTRYDGLLASASLARARGDVMAFVSGR
jgi:OMF family outer membrane factor